MPYYKRKANARKYTRKPRRIIRRKPTNAITRAVRQSHRIKYFTEMVDLGLITLPGGSIGNGYSWEAYLNLLPSDSLTAYRAMFDEYTIIKMVYQFIPAIGQYNYGSAPAPPMVHYAVNRDGAAGTPSASISVLSEDYVKTVVADGQRKIVVSVNNPKPYLKQTSGDTGGTLAVQQPYNKWVWLDLNDDDSINTKHYGIRMWIDNPSATLTTPYRVLCRMTMAFKEQQ